ncbi:MAG: hypothetical protein KGL39_44120, partial [Patescibacteria group bacterium]|nr:hypothetical protein [Patescibacteria group bacterium]
NPEWHFGRVGLSVYVQWSSDWEGDLRLGVSVPGASFWLSFDRLWPKWIRRLMPDEEHEIAISVHDGSLWWSLFHPVHSWESTTPKWRHGSWNPADTLLGRQKFSSRPLSFHRVTIPLPEGNIEGEVRIEQFAWKRPRWPWPTVRVSSNIKPDRAAVVPGKGENAWDCGDDAIYELSSPARTPAEAVSAYVRAVLRDRERYGGRDWKPSPVDAKS